MSADEDTELRDLVAQTLEANGTLGKIRAQLRASVFVALEEQDTVQNKTPFINQDLKKFLNSKEGRLATSLVREFLEFFGLDFSIAVFDPETGFAEKYEGRDNIAKELNILESDSSLRTPLLSEVLKRQGEEKQGRPKSSHEDDSQDYIKVPKDLSKKQIEEARKKFDKYDLDGSGTIDKDELRNLFADVFPHFHRNMLERYVNDEFQAVDRDFSNAIDFDEFLSMYKRLFVLCKSVVSHDISDFVPTSPRRTVDTTVGSKIPQPAKKGNNLVNGSNQPSNKTGSQQQQEQKKEHKLSTSSLGSDHDDDAFFDDPLPKSDKSYGRKTKKVSPLGSGKPSQIPILSPDRSNASKEKSSKDNSASSSSISQQLNSSSKMNKSGVQQTNGGSGMSSLQGMPPLGGSMLGSLKDVPPLPGVTKEKPDLNATADLEKDLRAIDKRIADLGFELPDDDDYEDDFQSERSDGKSNSQSARSNRSDKQDRSEKSQSIAEEIDEEIDEEDFSGADDILKSSGMDDLTTDRTISQQDMHGDLDYMEDVLTP
ncbi:FGFR1 oncogene partner isoform X2 [Lingula anatina]|uniref:FGFR1 oncogene partner isoform X2 n=1 Tax=Lingula anatina TaxID=7574 RepID=A0A1S3J0E2_LINAN|nr:FGFR1 oncogene partner isoform X2 [Lingula anatina]|eukprot:XP_013403917.1 FGFR1 oncogene partner isoform X2 [Lingula anatina]